MNQHVYKWYLLASMLIVGYGHGSELDRIVSDWNARQQRIRTIEVHVTGTRFFPRGSVTADPLASAGQPRRTNETLPHKDLKVECEFKYLLDFSNSWGRKERDTTDFDYIRGRFSKAFVVHAYDGTNYFLYKPRELNPATVKYDTDLRISAGSEVGSIFFDFHDFPILLGAGVIPRFGADTSITAVRIPNQIAAFKVYGTAKAGNGDNLVLRTTASNGIAGSYLEYWVDPSRESAVTRLRWVERNRAAHQLEVSYEETEHGWLPHEWKHQRFENEKLTSHLAVSSTIVSVNTALSRERFQIRAEAGMYIINDHTGEDFLLTEAGKRDRREVIREDASRRAIRTLLAIGADFEFDADGNPTSVDFHPNRVSDDDLKVLRLLPTLREVNLAYCFKVSDSGVEILTSLPNLEVLYLYRNNPTEQNNFTLGADLDGQPRITDISLQHISTITSLKQLHLWDNDFTDDGLARLHKLTNLQKLSFRSPYVSEAAVTSLRSALPNCEVN